MTKAAARLEQVAERLAAELVRRVVEARIEELVELSLGKRGPGRPRRLELEAKGAEPRQAEKVETTGKKQESRRKSSEVENLVERVVEYVAEKGGKEGVTIRELATGLRTERAKLIRPVQKALESRRVKKKGDRRFTRYFPGKE